MRSATLYLYAAILTLSIVLPVTPRAAAKEATSADPITVRIEPIKHTFAANEPILVKATIMNRGDSILYIGRDLSAPDNWMAHFHLDAYPLHEPSFPGYVGVGDPLPGSKEPFANALTKDWIALAPGYFYGTILRVYMPFAPSPRKAGLYRICGVLQSLGLEAPLYFNTLADHPNEISSLPFKAWKGKVKSNCVTIRLLAAKEMNRAPEH